MEKTLEKLLAQVGKDIVPQPAGNIAADAYSNGRLRDHATALHLVAFMLDRIHQLEGEVQHA